jgi:hypothetical protein
MPISTASRTQDRIQDLAIGSGAGWERTASLKRLDAAAGADRLRQAPHQTDVARSEAFVMPMIEAQVGDVLAVRVVTLVGDQVPVQADREPRRVCADRGGEMAKKPELHEVAHVARVPVLHPRKCPNRVL